MKKTLKSCMMSLLICLSVPSAAFADENSSPTVTLSAEAQAITEDFIRAANVMRRGNMDESRECRSSFEKLSAGSMGLIRLEMDSIQIPVAPSYSREDLYILAHVICGEAQSYPDEEQLYVGSVVLNRIKHPSFPDTLKGVVFQPGQYSCTRDGNYDREPTARNWANAEFLLEKGSMLPGNVVWQSGGRQGKGIYIRTRYHCYCY